VNHQLYSMIALSLAQERAAEADRYRQLAAAKALEPSSPSFARRSLARAVATFSRGSAWVVRRLDSCIADDLGRSLAPTE
jgi:hypothetical protein